MSRIPRQKHTFFEKVLILAFEWCSKNYNASYITWLHPLCTKKVTEMALMTLLLSAIQLSSFTSSTRRYGESDSVVPQQIVDQLHLLTDDRQPIEMCPPLRLTAKCRANLLLV